MGTGTHNRSSCCPPFRFSSSSSSSPPNVILFSHSASSDMRSSDEPLDVAESSPVKKGFVVHSVSKDDSLPSLAIRYGVEVMDIKRVNRIMNDWEIYALNTLLIPLPGPHSPSPIMHNSSTPESHNAQSNGLLEPITPLELSPSKEVFAPLDATSTKKNRTVSKAMDLLRGYYGLNSSAAKVEVDESHRNISTASFNSANFISSNSLSRWALPDDDDADKIFLNDDNLRQPSYSGNPATTSQAMYDYTLPLDSLSSFHSPSKQKPGDVELSTMVNSDINQSSFESSDIDNARKPKVDPVVAVIEELAKNYRENYREVEIAGKNNEKENEKDEPYANKVIRRRGKNEGNHFCAEEDDATNNNAVFDRLAVYPNGRGGSSDNGASGLFLSDKNSVRANSTIDFKSLEKSLSGSNFRRNRSVENMPTGGNSVKSAARTISSTPMMDKFPTGIRPEEDYSLLLLKKSLCSAFKDDELKYNSIKKL